LEGHDGCSQRNRIGRGSAYKQYWRFNPINKAIMRLGAGVDNMGRSPMLYKDGLQDLTGEQGLWMKITM